MALLKGGEPAYKALGNKLQSEIMAGKYDPNVPLPTENMLCETYGVSRFTVRKALETLVNEGLIYRRAGSGTYLTGLHWQRQYVRVLGNIEDLLAIGDETHLELEQPLQLEPSKIAAHRLQLEHEEIWAMRGVRHHSGSPFGYWEIYLPPEIGAMVRDKISGSENNTIIDQIERHLGVQISRAEQTISAEVAEAHVAEVLDIPVGSPVLHIERVYLDQTERPVEWAVSTYGRDQYKYRIDLTPRPNSDRQPHSKGRQ